MQNNDKAHVPTFIEGSKKWVGHVRVSILRPERLETAENGWEELRLLNQGQLQRIGLFNSVLLQQCRFLLQDPHHGAARPRWKAIFFTGSNLPVEATVDWYEEDIKADASVRSKVVWVATDRSDFESNKSIPSQAVTEASCLLRNTETLSRDHFEVEPHWASWIGQEGIAFISSAYHSIQFQRAVLLWLMGLAYLEALEYLSTNLSRGARDLNTSKAVVYDFTVFAAEYYFFLPVKVTQRTSVAVWGRIQDRLRLETLVDEVRHQAGDLARVLEERYREEREKAQAGMRRILLGVSALVTLLSALQGLEFFGLNGETVLQWIDSVIAQYQ